MRRQEQRIKKYPVLQGLGLAGLVAATAWRLHALSLSGAVAATGVGAAVYAGMGIRGSITLVTYFASASALGRLGVQPAISQRRGNRRDAIQVLANGGPAALFSALHALFPGASSRIAESAFYASIAAAAADTWASEVGTRWGGNPRIIVTGRRLLPGESGGVSAVGFAASVIASLAVAAAVPSGEDGRYIRATGCAAGGIAGALVDSLLGGWVQEQRWCPTCRLRTELLIHGCGVDTHRISGVPGVNNDVVNIVANFVGTLTAIALTAALVKLTRRNTSRVEFVTTLTSSRVAGPVGPW